MEGVIVSGLLLIFSPLIKYNRHIWITLDKTPSLSQWLITSMITPNMGLNYLRVLYTYTRAVCTRSTSQTRKYLKCIKETKGSCSDMTMSYIFSIKHFFNINRISGCIDCKRNDASLKLRFYIDNNLSYYCYTVYVFYKVF